jgi:signal transduction histidine kinase
LALDQILLVLVLEVFTVTRYSELPSSSSRGFLVRERTTGWIVDGIQKRLVARSSRRNRLATSMELKLVSKDRELSQLCAGILAETTQGQPWSLSTVSIEDLGEAADLYIWDFHPNASLPEHTRWTYSNLIVLAHRRDIAEVQKLLGFEPNIVLKPGTRAVLLAIIGLAVSNIVAVSLRDDRDQILQCLIEANLKLQEYDRDRTNFLTRVVHDFRSPLTALNGYCGLLLGDPLGSLNENQQEVIRRMQSSTKRLSRMVSAMLELSMGRDMKRGPDLQRADIRRSVDQALQEIGYLANDKHITLKCVLDPWDEGLYFDPAQLDQVFLNILDNACKFAPRNGSIEIRGYPFFWERRSLVTSVATLPKERRTCDAREPNSYRIDIRDSGYPIAAEHLETIFEEYTSYAGGRDRSGGGLGLAICRMVIDQHRGRVWADNTDKGPQFSFVLPLRKSGSTQPAQAVLSAAIGG